MLCTSQQNSENYWQEQTAEHDSIPISWDLVQYGEGNVHVCDECNTAALSLPSTAVLFQICCMILSWVRLHREVA